jgi:hypothetical protein
MKKVMPPAPWLAAQRIMMTRTYDVARAKERALRAAGVKTAATPRAEAAE